MLIKSFVASSKYMYPLFFKYRLFFHYVFFVYSFFLPYMSHTSKTFDPSGLEIKAQVELLQKTAPEPSVILF